MRRGAVLATAAVLALGAAGCTGGDPAAQSAAAVVSSTPVAPATEAAEEGAAPSATSPAAPSAVVPSRSPAPTPPPEETPSPGAPAAPAPARPPHPVSMAAFAAQDFRGGDLRLRRVLDRASSYVTHAVTYESDGLTISGIMLVPTGRGPYPVVVLNHGHVEPSVYVTGQGFARTQGYLAERGFVVLHTDYRNHAGSDDDPRNELLLRHGYAADAINAVQAVKASGLPQVDPERVAYLGRSMGGGVTLDALVARPGLVDAAVTFASVSSNAADNFNRWVRPDDSAVARRILRTYGAPEDEPAFWRAASSVSAFDRITEPVLMHHGTSDGSCPYPWAGRTIRALQRAGVDAQLLTYEGEGHAFGAAWLPSMQRTVAFLREQLRA